MLRIVELPKEYITDINKLYQLYMLEIGKIDLLFYRKGCKKLNILGLQYRGSYIGFVTIFKQDDIVLVTHTYILPAYRFLLVKYGKILLEKYRNIATIAENDKIAQLFVKMGYERVKNG